MWARFKTAHFQTNSLFYIFEIKGENDMWDDCLNFITLTTGIPEHDRLEYLKVAKAYEQGNDIEQANIYYKLAAEVGTIYEHI
jgi:CRISPR/Cas system CSM-associated protein Csm4 (group 5 of RAMP superfamily)